MTMLATTFKSVVPSQDVIAPADLEFIKDVQKTFDGRMKRLEFTVSMLSSIIQKQNDFIAEHGDYPIGFNFKKRAAQLLMSVDEFKQDVRDEIVRYINNQYELKIDKTAYNPSQDAQGLYLQILGRHNYSFSNSGFERFKEMLNNELAYRKPDNKGNKLTIAQAVQVEPRYLYKEECNIFKVTYSYSDRLQTIIDCLYFYEKKVLKTRAYNIAEFPLNVIIPIGLSQVKGIKFFKNGRIDIEFTTSESALGFLMLFNLETK